MIRECGGNCRPAFNARWAYSLISWILSALYSPIMSASEEEDEGDYWNEEGRSAEAGRRAKSSDAEEV